MLYAAIETDDKVAISINVGEMMSHLLNFEEYVDPFKDGRRLKIEVPEVKLPPTGEFNFHSRHQRFNKQGRKTETSLNLMNLLIEVESNSTAENIENISSEIPIEDIISNQVDENAYDPNKISRWTQPLFTDPY
jgi:hypothetical protein